MPEGWPSLGQRDMQIHREMPRQTPLLIHAEMPREMLGDPPYTRAHFTRPAVTHF